MVGFMKFNLYKKNYFKYLSEQVLDEQILSHACIKLGI